MGILYLSHVANYAETMIFICSCVRVIWHVRDMFLFLHFSFSITSNWDQNLGLFYHLLQICNSSA